MFHTRANVFIIVGVKCDLICKGNDKLKILTFMDNNCPYYKSSSLKPDKSIYVENKHSFTF